MSCPILQKKKALVINSMGIKIYITSANLTFCTESVDNSLCTDKTNPPTYTRNANYTFQEFLDKFMKQLVPKCAHRKRSAYLMS